MRNPDTWRPNSHSGSATSRPAISRPSSSPLDDRSCDRPPPLSACRFRSARSRSGTCVQCPLCWQGLRRRTSRCGRQRASTRESNPWSPRNRSCLLHGLSASPKVEGERPSRLSSGDPRGPTSTPTSAQLSGAAANVRAAFGAAAGLLHMLGVAFFSFSPTGAIVASSPSSSAGRFRSRGRGAAASAGSESDSLVAPSSIGAESFATPSFPMSAASLSWHGFKQLGVIPPNGSSELAPSDDGR